MRPSVVVMLVLGSLLAGCTDSSPAAPDHSSDDATDAAAPVASNASVDAPGLSRLTFGGSASEQAELFSGTFPVGHACLPFLEPACGPAQRHDLTSLVTAAVPTQVSVDVRNEGSPGTFISRRLEVDGGWFTLTPTDDEEGDEDLLVAVVLLEPGGTLTLVLQLILPAFVPPGETTYTAEARSVVRPDIIPRSFPVALDLEVGDTVAVRSPGLRNLVVIPPSGSPVHRTVVPFDFNASAATGGSGRHVVILDGSGDFSLLGPANRTLTPLEIQTHLGEPHAVSSGQETTWDFTIPGVPLLVGMQIGHPDTASGFSLASAYGSYELGIERQGSQLVAVVGGCPAICQFAPLQVAGFRDAGYGAFLDERLGPGTYQAKARFELSSNVLVREAGFYVLP